jgi:hypothetical protein
MTMLLGTTAKEAAEHVLAIVGLLLLLLGVGLWGGGGGGLAHNGQG